MAPKKAVQSERRGRRKPSSPGACVPGSKAKPDPKSSSSQALSVQDTLTRANKSRRLRQDPAKTIADNIKNMMFSRYGDWDAFYKFQNNMSNDEGAPITFEKAMESEYSKLMADGDFLILC